MTQTLDAALSRPPLAWRDSTQSHSWGHQGVPKEWWPSSLPQYLQLDAILRPSKKPPTATVSEEAEITSTEPPEQPSSFPVSVPPW